MDRDILVKLGVVEKVINRDVLESVYVEEPFVFKLIMDKFKQFLEDDYFDVVERQIVLLKFLKTNYPLEISRPIVEFAQQCSLKDDYTTVILEWNLHSSEFNKQYNLMQYDGLDLVLTPEQKQAMQEKLSSSNLLEAITDVILDGITVMDKSDEDD